MECDLGRLVRYIDRDLDLDEQLLVLSHLDECKTCLEMIYRISRERDADLFIYRPYKPGKVPVGCKE